MKKHEFITVGLLVIAGLTSCWREEGSKDRDSLAVFAQSAPPSPAKARKVKEFYLGSYKFRTWMESMIEGRMETLRGDKVVYAEEGGSFSVIDVDAEIEDRGNEGVAPKDITGDGIADIVIESFTGEAHCCFEYLVLSLGENLEMVGRLATGNGVGVFRDLNGDGIYEVTQADETFTY